MSVGQGFGTFESGYDNGIYLRLLRGDDSFELKTNLRSQFRVVSFSPDAESWTDNAGVVRPIEDRQNFDVERLRIVLSGHAFTPELKYFLQMDGDTDSQHVISVLDGWVGWHFSDAFEVQAGKRKVPGTRNWLLGAFDTRLVDRPFANEFFRPSRTTGVWFVGDPTETTHYELMVGQGYNTEGLTPSQSGNDFATGGSVWWDVTGNYGPGRPMDFEIHDELAVRIGTSMVFSNEGTPGRQLEEADFLRLTDGTRLTQTDALAPGATVESFNVALLALDAAFKYRGWSANGEYFFRDISDLAADLPVPDVGVQQGFYVEGGFFLLPQQLELNSQMAYVTSKFGDRTSYAAGVSYYPRRSQYLKLTIDATVIDGSPVNSTGSDILVGDDGLLIRTQFQALF
ncbi:MAG: porin [Planctomycetaceae bacterium]